MKSDTQKFNDLHERGIERFKLRWLAVNQALAETAKTNGIDLDKNRLALTRMAWRVLMLDDVDIQERLETLRDEAFHLREIEKDVKR